MVKITSLSYYNPATGVYEATPPSIERNQTGGIAVVVENDTLLERDVTMEIAVTAPDGTVSTASDTKTIAAGEVDTFYFSFTADQDGEYYASGNVILGTKNFTNLLINPSFETGDPPTNWVAYRTTVSREGTIVKDGNYSLKLKSNSSWAYVDQHYAGYASLRGLPVALSFWGYAPPTNDRDQKLSLHDGVTETWSSALKKNGAWHSIQITKVLDSAASGLRIALYVNGTGYVDTDDILYADDAWLVAGDCAPGVVETFESLLVATVAPTLIGQLMPIVSSVLVLGMLGILVFRMFK